MRMAWICSMLVAVTAMPALAADSEVARKKFFAGAGLFEAGEYTEAIPRLEEALQLDPGFCRVNFYLARSYQETGDDTRAHASATAYKACASDSEQADADALLASIPVPSGGTVTDSGGGGGSRETTGGGGSASEEVIGDAADRHADSGDDESIRAAYEDDDEGRSLRDWGDDEDTKGTTARYEVDRVDDRAEVEEVADVAEDVVEDVAEDRVEDVVEDTAATDRWGDEDTDSRWEDEDSSSRWEDGEDSGRVEDVEDVVEDVVEDRVEDEIEDRVEVEDYDAHDSRYDAGTASRMSSGADVSVKRRRTAGGVLLGVGAATAAGGFILSYSMYSKYYWEPNGDMYQWARNTNVAGFAIGIAGAAMAGTGLILAIIPGSSSGRTALVPGPVTTFTMKF